MTYDTVKSITAVHPMPPLSGLAFAIALTVLKWEQRRKTRRDLGRMDPHLLRDIGLSADIARTEAEKPFWRG
jgi:uncharacterized protein YjiS (DUF1127 family)